MPIPSVMFCLTRVLLVTAHDCYETDFLGGHRDALQQHGNISLELAYFDLSRKLGFFEILILLGHVKAGFFTAVHLAPPASTWSRIRHSCSSGQPSLRTREHPTGLSHLSPQLQLKVEESNRQIETLTWLFEQAVLCAQRKVWVLRVFPEDLGGHVQSGPTSIWSSSHLRKLDGISDVQRGAAFLCQFAGTESRRPVGLFTNIKAVKAQMVNGWPRLYRVNKYFMYDGPVNDKCSCTKPHTPIRGVNSHEEFLSSASAGFGKRFWSLSHASLVVEEHVLLRAGGTSSTSSSLSPSHLSSAPLFSLAGHSGSASSLYYAWSYERPSRSMLSVFSGSGNASMFFDSHTSQLCRLTPCHFGPGPGGSQSGNDGTGSSASSSTTRPHSSGSLQAPLVTVSPRGDGGWTHGGMDMDSAPVTAVPVRHGDTRPCPCVSSLGRSLV